MISVPPPIIGIVGWKNSGKTTLTVGLVEELVGRGLRVSTIKHAHAHFDIDHPGRDSHRHRTAGASEVAIVSPKRWAVMHELRGEPEPSLDEMVARMSPCDLIVVEGYKNAAHFKVEVRRHGARQRDPIAPSDPSVIAVASDDPSSEPPSPPVFGISDVPRIADLICAQLQLGV